MLPLSSSPSQFSFFYSLISRLHPPSSDSRTPFSRTTFSSSSAALSFAFLALHPVRSSASGVSSLVPLSSASSDWYSLHPQLRLPIRVGVGDVLPLPHLLTHLAGSRLPQLHRRFLHLPTHHSHRRQVR